LIVDTIGRVQILLGDILSIDNEEEPGFAPPTLAEVTAIRVYTGKDPLLEYLLAEGLGRTLPGIETLTEAIEVYLKFWPAAEIKRLGMRAFTLKVMQKE
jgi:ASC-1-like (ASCH) protein